MTSPDPIEFNAVDVFDDAYAFESEASNPDMWFDGNIVKVRHYWTVLDPVAHEAYFMRLDDQWVRI